MKIFTLVSLGLIAFCVMLSIGLVWPLKAANAQETPSPKVLARPAAAANIDDWMNSRWILPDEPFTTIRANIDEELRHSPSPSKILRGVEKRYLDTATPASIFATMYAGYTSLKYLDNGSDDYNLANSMASGAFRTLCSSPSRFPHTYNFTRVAFLMTYDGSGGQLNSVWRRLLDRNPTDDEVKYTAICWLEYSKNPIDRALAYRMANERLSAEPDDAQSYSLMAQVRFANYQISGDVKYAKMAISLYDRAIALQTVGSGRKKCYIDCISAIEDAVKRHT